MAQRNAEQKRKLKRRLFGKHDTRPCCFCRYPLCFDMATLEHVIPLSRGGGWTLDNLRISCSPCNSERRTEDFEGYKKRVHGSTPGDLTD